ncbi:MAG: hydrogenase maturation protein HypF, partial [Chloroflexi bacterium OLB15]
YAVTMPAASFQSIQHHYAHILSCMAENQLEAPVLGGGMGRDRVGNRWHHLGRRILLVDDKTYTRIGHLRPFPLPGGEAAAREPRRSLLGLLYAMYGADLPRERLQFTPKELQLLLTALDKGINAPLTSSMGRLFDAVAALAGIRQRCSFEGQAAMALEFAAMSANTDECYPFQITPVTNANGIKKQMIEWKPMLAAMLAEVDAAAISTKFHNTLAAIIVQMAQQAGILNIALSGGCFQNRLLLELTVARLRASGFRPYWQRQIPPNDGGIALGQIAAALREGNLCV